MSKPSKLTFADQSYIERHYLEKTDEEMAEALACSAKNVKDYRVSKNLLKNDPRKGADSEDARIAQFRRKFIKSQRYKNLQTSLSEQDLVYFTNLWVEYQGQFEDLHPTEEDSLEILILTKLRIHENVRDTTNCLKYEEELRKKLGTRIEKELDLENEQDRFLFEHIASNNRLKQDLNKDYRELIHKFDAIQKALAGTREQREQKEHIGADTFLGLIKSFNDRDIREKAAHYNELMKKATENQKIKYNKEHKLSDGTTSKLIVSGNDNFITKEPTTDEK